MDEATTQEQLGVFLDLASMTSFGGLDDRTVSHARYYELNVVTDGKVFHAVARDQRTRVNASGTDDVWYIDEGSPMPVHVKDGCGPR